MSRPIEILIDHPTLRCRVGSIRAMVRIALSEIGIRFPAGDLSLALLTDDRLAVLHDDFLNDPTLTDVITFPGDSAMEFAGEVCVSVDRALAVCAAHGHVFEEELTLYLVHGLLHLGGWDDKTDADRLLMREAEARVMQVIADADAVPPFAIKPSKTPFPRRS
jgi:probable rRNA maturation factor